MAETPTSFTIHLSSSTVVPGTSVTFSQSGLPQVSSLTAGDTVTYEDMTVPASPVVLCVATLSVSQVANGTAGATSCFSSSAGIGNHPDIVGVFAGDPSYATSTSTNSAALNVAETPTNFTIHLSSSTVVPGTSVTFSQSGLPQVSSLTAGDTVTYEDMTVPASPVVLCVATLSVSQVANGTAGATSCFSSSAGIGNHPDIVGVFAGDPSYATSTSTNSAALNVAETPTSFTIHLLSSTVVPGTSVTFSQSGLPQVSSLTAGDTVTYEDMTVPASPVVLCAAALSVSQVANGTGVRPRASPAPPGSGTTLTSSGSSPATLPYATSTSTNSAALNVAETPTNFTIHLFELDGGPRDLGHLLPVRTAPGLLAHRRRHRHL